MNISPQIEQIEFACEEIESDFQKAGKKRKNGEGYESHPYEVTRLFIELWQRSINTNTLIACLLHDHIEDIRWIDYEHIETSFNPEVAFLVHLLSKPQIEWDESKMTQEQREELKRKRNEDFFQNFQSLKNLQAYIQQEASKLWFPLHKKYKEGTKNGLKKKARIIATLKICDRIHNLYTIDDFSPEKIKEKIEETEKYLIPLAHELSQKDTAILDMLRKALLYAHKKYTQKSARASLEKR